MTQRVGVTFDGSARGAVAASKQAAQGIAQVRREAAGASPSLHGLENDLGRTTRGAIAGSGAFRGLGRSIAFASAGFLGGFGLAAALRGAADELVNQVKVNAQVGAALRSTGGVAGVTARQIDELAQAELRKTGIDDEVIKSAETMLLRFTQVRNVAGAQNDIFTRATKTSLDLAQALGRDATDAAFALGKALQDPTRGVQQLRRVGAAFTGEEAKQIKQLAEHGHVLEAQKLILDSLARAYGGTAVAVSNAAPWVRLRETLKNLSADAIRPLLPELDGLAEKAQAWADHLEHDSAAQQRLRDDVKEAIGVAKNFASAADNVAGALGGWKRTLELLLAFKVVSIVSGWTASLRTLIGTEAAAGAAGGSGLLGASAAAGVLRGRLLALTRLGTISIALEAVDAATGNKITHWLAHDDRNPIVWLANKINELVGLQPLVVPTPTGAPVQVGADAAKGTAGAKVAGFAKRFGVGSGIRYHWGGISPVTGFDCSGYVYSAYKSAGVDIPRDTRGQWNDPNAVKVPIGEERPGDAVYFTGSLTGKNAGPPPGHVGIYLGGGIFIEYFSEGQPAKTDNLANRPDYMGARRWLKIKDSKGAAPPKGGTTPAARSSQTLPSRIRQAISAAGVAAAAAALTPGKADDRAAIRQQRAALDDEIAWLNAKLKTKLGAEKRITLEDLLTSALGDLAALTPDAKKKRTSTGATVSAITSLRASVNEQLRDLPPILDAVERQAVTRLDQLRDHLKVGMKAKDLADTRAGIRHWGNVLKDEISKQAKQAADAATEAARLWQRGWQNDVDRILRDFNEDVVQRQLTDFDDATSAHLKQMQADLTGQLDQFDRDTQTHLKQMQAAGAALTPEEQAYSLFQASRAADDAAKHRADLLAQIADVQAQLASLGGATAASTIGTLIDIATGNRSPLLNTAGQAGEDLVSQRESLQKQLLDLQAQFHGLELDDQEAALKAAADASRKAADEQEQQAELAYQDDRDRQRSALEEKEQADEVSYQRQRDGQRQALQDKLDDQAKFLQQDLDDWNLWLDTKTRSWAAFLKYLQEHGISTVVTDPATAGALGAFVPVFGDRPFAARGTVGTFQHGGGVPGPRYGAEDTVWARVSGGERVLDRRVNAALEQLVMGGGLASGGPVVALFQIDGREFARATAQPMSDEQARIIGYRSQRS